MSEALNAGITHEEVQRLRAERDRFRGALMAFMEAETPHGWSIGGLADAHERGQEALSDAMMQEREKVDE